MKTKALVDTLANMLAEVETGLIIDIVAEGKPKQ